MDDNDKRIEEIRAKAAWKGLGTLKGWDVQQDVSWLLTQLQEEREEVGRLRAALRPLCYEGLNLGPDDMDSNAIELYVTVAQIRRARAALEDTHST